MIEAIGHDEDTLELHVKMTSGSTYAYSNVPVSVADDFRSATSVGRHFNDHIRGQYEGRKL